MAKKRARMHAFIPATAVVVAGILILASNSSAFGYFATAADAYEAGNYHFDATDPKHYDLEKAERYFKSALEMDMHHAGAYHQLARLAFLRGEFPQALALINTAITVGGEQPIRSSYYIRALIKGYMDDFSGSAADYKEYLRFDSTNWAAVNDLAWVLIKEKKYDEAVKEIEYVLQFHPENPWLLNSKATALYELGRIDEALVAVEAAAQSVIYVTEAEWSLAYPGNDPLIAPEGLDAFRTAVMTNLQVISEAAESRTSSE